MQFICESCGVVVRAGVEAQPKHCNEFMTETEIPGEVLDESQYHNLVYHVVREEGPLMGCEVIYEIGASPGTIYPRLNELDDKGVIESRPAPEYGTDALRWATDADAFDDHTVDEEDYRPLA